MARNFCKFLTRNDGNPLTFGILVDGRQNGMDLGPAQFRELAAMANSNPGACAFGKIVVLGHDGIFTYQATPSGEVVAVFCGNSTAAAIGYLGVDGAISTKVHGAAGACYDVSAKIDGDAVAQSWVVPSGAVEERSWRGCRVLFLRTMNDYAIVLGALPSNVDPDVARHELLGATHAGKLAVVGGSGAGSVVEFYNSNGRHGAVPQTGIASIALAARAIPWLGDFFPDDHLTYLTGGGPMRARLPEIADTPGGEFSIALPRITVSLTPLAMELVA